MGLRFDLSGLFLSFAGPTGDKSLSFLAVVAGGDLDASNC